ncbi:hypothetical protein GCM10009733_006870 [Nonomuraea maheshkhaliensis]|uniref:HTH tetR-type domain-containing protein n=1 Tax=Nonomuraea maheshkhaliensis TaxID=419590 RepID=A0ABN2EPA3_9ACTN
MRSKPARSAGDVKRERTRAVLLSAARAKFTEHGWHHTRMDDVARAAGVSSATAYNHFKSKQILMGFVYRPLIGRLSEAVKSTLEVDSDPVDVILRHFYDLVALARRWHRLTEALVAAMKEQTLRHGTVSAEFDEADVRHLVPLCTMLADLMEHGQKHGVLRSGPSVIKGAAFYTDALLHQALNLHEESAHDTALNMLDQLLSTWAANPGSSSDRASITVASDRMGEEDLSWVLHRLMRLAADGSRRALANDSLTREYLEAGLRLSTIADGPGTFLGLPSEREICQETERAGRAPGNEEDFRTRWPSRDDFALDLLAYALWARHGRPGSIGRSADLISNAVDPVQGAQEASCQELASLLENPAMGLSLVATAMADRFPELKATAGSARSAVRQRWIPIYEEMLAVNAVGLRPGVTVEDLADILAVTVEGVAFRALSGPAEDRERLELTLRKAVLAVLVSTVDSGDDLSLDEHLRRIIRSPPATSDLHHTGTAGPRAARRTPAGPGEL